MRKPIVILEAEDVDDTAPTAKDVVDTLHEHCPSTKTGELQVV